MPLLLPLTSSSTKRPLRRGPSYMKPPPLPVLRNSLPFRCRRLPCDRALTSVNGAACWLICPGRSIASLAACCPGPGASSCTLRKAACESVKSGKAAGCLACLRRRQRPTFTAATSASKASTCRPKWMPRPAHPCLATVLRCGRNRPPT